MVELLEHDDLCNEPLEVAVQDQAVVLVGPNGIALAMTVEAAEKSIAALRHAVSEINGDR